MAHALHLKVVAEGVETDAQRQFLAANGCDEMQGYYFARLHALYEFLSVSKTFELRSALGLARLYSTSGRAGVSEGLAPVLADFDTRQDLPEIQEAEKLLKQEHYASQSPDHVLVSSWLRSSLAPGQPSPGRTPR